MIHAKLLEFQKLGITLERDSTNPHFRSQYVSLNEVLAKVKKPLNDLGVVIVQTPERDGLHTYLIDSTEPITLPAPESDAWDRNAAQLNQNCYVESFVPYIGATDMQKLGGAITYARRYSLIALLGLEDADDDGNAASAPNVAPRAAQWPTAAVQTFLPPEEPVISIDDLTY